MLPPAINHVRYDKKDNLPQIAIDAAAAIKMSKGEGRLLAYYAAQSSGFRPAVSTIMKYTGLSRSQIFRNRQKLIDHGLALMIMKGETNTQFAIDWSRAKTYATLNRQMVSKTSRFAQMTPAKAQCGLSIFYLKYGDLKEIVQQLNKMSETEYNALVRKVNNARA